jgi:hypothetical protein
MRPFCARAHIKGGRHVNARVALKVSPPELLRINCQVAGALCVCVCDDEMMTTHAFLRLLCMTYSVQENYNFIVNFLLFLLSG